LKPKSKSWFPSFFLALKNGFKKWSHFQKIFFEVLESQTQGILVVSERPGQKHSKKYF